MKNNASQVKFLFAVWLAALALGLCNGSVRAGDGHDEDRHRSTAADFLQLDVRPIAIGHHGVGP